MKPMILILAAGILLLAVVACNDESQPVITRIFAAPSCGVAPMQVEVYGIASGGNESGSATGGNNNLDFTWDFGDGQTSNTSIGYHTFTAPGDYLVTLRVEDPDGKTATRTVPVVVVADSLQVEAAVETADPIDTTMPVAFNYRAGSCGVDPDSESDRASYLRQTWTMGDAGFPDGGVYSGPQPEHTFSAPGTYQVVCTVTYTAWAVTRRDTVTVVVN